MSTDLPGVDMAALRKRIAKVPIGTDESGRMVGLEPDEIDAILTTITEAVGPALVAADKRYTDEERIHGVTIDQRDYAEEWADRLAYALYTFEEIGEHSTANNPWANAYELMTATPPKLYTEEEMQVALAAAEDQVIALAHRLPCDCGSNEHYPTPTRSVTGAVTYYCQFSRVVPSATPPKTLEQEAEGGPAIAEAHKHKWDKETGTKIRMLKMIGRSPTVRTCTSCGYVEEYLNGPIHYGWYKASRYAASCAPKPAEAPPKTHSEEDKQ